MSTELLPAPDVSVDVDDTGEVLSPSRLNCYLSCSARYYYKYRLGLPDQQGSSLAVGKALHATMKENFTAKMETREDLPVTAALSVYKDAWMKEEPVTVFQKDEDRAELRAMGAKLVAKFMETTAPLIEPAAVELPVSGVISGVRVQGIVDLMDSHGRIIDLKSANRDPSKGKIRPDYRLQVATYSEIAPGASGEAEVFTLVKLQKECKVISQSFTVMAADKRSVEVLYPLGQEGMASGIYTPNRQSLLCGKYCPFTKACVDDFGGVIDGEECE